MIRTSVGEIKKSTQSKWEGVFPKDHQGPGLLVEGTVQEIRNHTYTDSNGDKFRFQGVVLSVKSARIRSFDENGQEVMAASQAHTKKKAGFLNKFHDVEADRFLLSDQELQRKLPVAVERSSIVFMGEPEMMRKADVVKGDNVRVKTMGDSHFIENFTKLADDSKSRADYHGESFLNQLQSKSADNESSGAKKVDENDFERDEDEWADSDSD